MNAKESADVILKNFFEKNSEKINLSHKKNIFEKIKQFIIIFFQ
jgi:hypothetical protein